MKRYPRTAVVISHDRELLNNSVDHILHIRDGKLDLYAGGYDDFERRGRRKQRLAGAQAAKQEAERAKLQAFVDRFRAKATKAAQAQSRMKRLAKMQAVTVSVESEAAPFTLPSPERPLNPPLVRLEKAAVGYDGRAILRNLTLRLDVDDRIGLLGVNGAGKSTFAKLLAEALTPMAGELARQPRMRVGWFNQHQIEAMDPAGHPAGHDPPRLAGRDGTAPAPQAGPIRHHLGEDGRPPPRTTPAASGRGCCCTWWPCSAPHLLILGRAHQPPRHRQPARPDGGAERLRGRGAPDHPRPLP